LVAVIACTACGSGVYDGVVARVGGAAISKSTLDHWTAAKTSGPAKGQAQQLSVLSSLITAQWLIGEAAEQGVRVSSQEIQHRFEEKERESAPNGEAEFREFLEESGQTASDMRFDIEVELARARLRTFVMDKLHTITPAQIATYYAANRQRFVIPEERAIEIVEVESEALAAKAKREIESGRSIASMHPLHESIVRFAHAGNPRWEAIERAIFSAKSNVLTGPLRLIARHAVFEVSDIAAPIQKTLAEVQSAITETLAAEQRRRTLAEFARAWITKWTARTDCHLGFVVQQCREYQGPKATQGEDPFTLG
jgi:hypothetical protein